MKMQKGITLVALIITIIILLILAVVAIRAVTGDGIIAHAKNAREQYEQKAAEENDLLEDLSGYITDQLSEGWVQNKIEVKNVKTKQMLTVGQTVTNYTAGGKTWKVLGAENGKLLLMATTNVKDNHELSGSTAGWNTAENRFVRAETELDNECKTAIPDIGEAESIRSAKVEDINRVTGYNPAVTGDGSPHGSGNTNQYGNEVTYRLNGEKVAYTSATKSADTSDSSRFTHPDGRKLGENGVENITVKSSSYGYYPATLTTGSSGEVKGIAIDSDGYKLLFRNEGDTEYANYWLASSYANANVGYVLFGIREVRGGDVSGYYLWNSRSGSNSRSDYGVRPVVILGDNFQPIV